MAPSKKILDHPTFIAILFIDLQTSGVYLFVKMHQSP
jgi:hypothetical protein